jgi:hypothetical protein
LYYPEFITEDGYIIINENNLKVFGRITNPLFDTGIAKKFAPGGPSQTDIGTKEKKKRRHSEVSGGGDSTKLGIT